MMRDRQRLAELWHDISHISRDEIFGKEDRLRPEYQNTGPKIGQIDVPALGYVGPRVGDFPMAFVSVNPAGAKGDASSTDVDDRLYHAFRNISDVHGTSELEAAFEEITECFSTSIPTWTIWRQYIQPILRALALDFEETCYLYLVPFRTDGDAGSKLKDVYTRAGYERNLKRQLDVIEPSLIVAVDRPSERYCREWVAETGRTGEVIYFTRKRDAHSARRDMLAQFEKRARRK